MNKIRDEIETISHNNLYKTTDDKIDLVCLFITIDLYSDVSIKIKDTTWDATQTGIDIFFDNI